MPFSIKIVTMDERSFGTAITYTVTDRHTDTPISEKRCDTEYVGIN